MIPLHVGRVKTQVAHSSLIDYLHYPNISGSMSHEWDNRERLVVSAYRTSKIRRALMIYLPLTINVCLMVNATLTVNVGLTINVSLMVWAALTIGPSLNIHPALIVCIAQIVWQDQIIDMMQGRYGPQVLIPRTPRLSTLSQILQNPKINKELPRPLLPNLPTRRTRTH